MVIRRAKTAPGLSLRVDVVGQPGLAATAGASADAAKSAETSAARTRADAAQSAAALAAGAIAEAAKPPLAIEIRLVYRAK